MRGSSILQNLAVGVIRPVGTLSKPKTPIRWLCLKSFSYIARTQNQCLTADTLNRAMELGVYLNRCFDRKCLFQAPVYRRLRKELPLPPTRRYLRQLRDLEMSRPELEDWRSIYHYRRSVLEVSLNYLFHLSGLDSRRVLLPLCSLVQLADDVLDRSVDEKLGLPTFVSVGGPCPRTLAEEFWDELRTYRAPEDRPFLATGWLVYLFTRVVIACR